MKITKNKKTKLLAALVISSIMLTFYGCKSAAAEPLTKTGFYFDTVISVTLYGTDKEPYIEHCFEMAKQYESYFSPTIADSDISNINSHVGEPVTVHKETVELIQRGIDYYYNSNGKFDITVGALSSLWDFSSASVGGAGTDDVSNAQRSIPSAEDLQRVLPTIDASKIVIEGDTVMLTAPGSSLDLGGIAKGYIADRMKEYLNSQGITSGTINLGGNLLVLGPKENQESKSYTIGIQDPFSDDGSAIAAVKITDESVVTSGIYQRCFEQDGVLYHHLLDTATGYPYHNGLASVTIISPLSVDGDALSTTCFMMGLTDGMNYAETLEDVEAIFITTEGEIYYTSGIGTKIPFEKLR